MSGILTVFGATGNQGGSVIRTILADPALSKKWKLRAVTRDTSKPAAQQLAAAGVEMVTADMSTVESVLPAVSGAHTVFLVTNFWETMRKDVEVSQGKAVTDACKQAGVKHLIYSSLLNITDLTRGRLSHMSHFDGKAEVEVYIRGSGIPCTFVLAGFFMSNFFQFLRKRGEGNYVFGLPIDMEKARFPLFDAGGDTGKFVKAAITHFPSTAGQRILAATDYYTAQRIVDEFSDVTGSRAEVAQISPEAFKEFFPPQVADEMMETMVLLVDPGYYGGESLGPSLALLGEDENQRPTGWREFVRRNREKW